FRMFGMMNGDRISVKSDNGLKATDIIAKGVRERNDVNAIASKSKTSICILIWNYHDDDVTSLPSPVELTINNIDSNKVLLHHYRIDQQFSNSFEKWKAMGKPQTVTNEQYQVLEKAGQLQLFSSPEWKKTNKGELILKFDLPGQGVSLIQLTL